MCNLFEICIMSQEICEPVSSWELKNDTQKKQPCASSVMKKI
jgi:hypothetical protein